IRLAFGGISSDRFGADTPDASAFARPRVRLAALGPAGGGKAASHQVRSESQFEAALLALPPLPRVHAMPRQPSSTARASPTGPPPTIRTGCLWEAAFTCHSEFGLMPRTLATSARFTRCPSSEAANSAASPGLTSRIATRGHSGLMLAARI